jgi:general secretion pathway protein G
MKRSAFTMIELVFVIVILGILASIAVPKLTATRDDAMFAKGKADINTVRSAIVEIRSRNIMEGNNAFPDALTSVGAPNGLFDLILDYPIGVASGGSGWIFVDENNYIFRLQGNDVSFSYNPATGRFTCDINESDLCKQLSQ